MTLCKPFLLYNLHQKCILNPSSGRTVLRQHGLFVRFTSHYRPITYWDWSDIAIWYQWCCSDSVWQYKTSCYRDINVVFVSDKDENAIKNGKHVDLFHLSKYPGKLYGNIVLKWAISFKYQIYFYLLRFQTFNLKDFLDSPYIN